MAKQKFSPEDLEDLIKCPSTYIDYHLVRECCAKQSIVVQTCDGYNLDCKTRRDYIKSLTKDEALEQIKRRLKK